MARRVESVQADFRAGAFPGLEDVPANGAVDIVNGLLQDDGSILERGGTVYKSNAPVGVELLSLWDGYVAAGRRTVAQRTANLYVLDPANDATLFVPRDLAAELTLGDPSWALRAYGRPRGIGGAYVRAARITGSGVDFPYLMTYGGAATHTVLGGDLSGSVTVTQGSRTVTASTAASNFAAARPGSVLKIDAGFGKMAVVKSVDSTTQLTLFDEWPFATQTAPAAQWSIAPMAYDFMSLAIPVTGTGTGEMYLATAGGRLWVAIGNKVFESTFSVDGNGVARAMPFAFTSALNPDVLDLPEGVIAVGLEALGDTVLVFTTAGVWQITNASLDLTDDFGNQQQAVQQVNRDVILWGGLGVATWQNAVVVPATDDVYLFTPDEVRPVTGGGQRLYRQYVRTGCRPGQAAVYAGHYYLPILAADGQTPVDQLVWRLDAAGEEGAPLVRMAGHLGKARAFAVRGSDPSRSPVLLAAIGQQVVDCTNAFDPVTAGTYRRDADGSLHELEVQLRPQMASETQRHTVLRARVRYEITGGQPAYLGRVDATGGTFTLSVTRGSTQTTVALPFNVALVQVRAALEALSNLEPGEVAVDSSVGGSTVAQNFIVTFGDFDVSAALNAAGLTGGPAVFSQVWERSSVRLAVARDGAAFSELSAVGAPTARVRAWRVNATAQQVRLRVRVTGAPARAVLRAVDVSAELGRG